LPSATVTETVAYAAVLTFVRVAARFIGKSTHRDEARGMKNEAFGAGLRRILENEGFTFAALAKEMGISGGTLRQLETGKVRSPSFTTGLRRATVPHVHPYELCFADGTGSIAARLARVEAQLAYLERFCCAQPASSTTIRRRSQATRVT